MTHPKVQHYVPDFLLRKFCAPTSKGRRLHVFDKQTGSSFPTNTKNIACEGGFYDFELDDATYSIETTLSNVETLARPAIEQLLDSKVEPRSPQAAESLAAIAMFVAV